eukprot:gene20992-biopygen19154
MTIDAGCHGDDAWDASNAGDDIHAYEGTASSTAAVRCCSANGDDCISEGVGLNCERQKTLAEAMSLRAGVSRRLCTLTEMHDHGCPPPPIWPKSGLQPCRFPRGNGRRSPGRHQPTTLLFVEKHSFFTRFERTEAETRALGSWNIKKKGPELARPENDTFGRIGDGIVSVAYTHFTLQGGLFTVDWAIWLCPPFPPGGTTMLQPTRDADLEAGSTSTGFHAAHPNHGNHPIGEELPAQVCGKRDTMIRGTAGATMDSPLDQFPSNHDFRANTHEVRMDICPGQGALYSKESKKTLA